MHEKLNLNIEADKPQDNCAVVGVFSRTEDVSQIALEGLIELNHRGQEGAGIVASNGRRFKEIKDSGLAETVFRIKHDGPPRLRGSFIALAQDRYSTSGSLDEIQPFIEDGIALSHNGNFTNVEQLKEEYDLPDEIDGARSDSRVGLAVINKMPGIPEERIKRGIPRLEGASSLVISTLEALYASRGAHGFKPLTIGRLKNEKGYVVVSETAALRLMGAEFLRDVEPGETIRIDDSGVTTVALDKRKISQCIFELGYIGRIDSKIFGIPVAEFRRRQGGILARHLPEWARYIAPVPNSGRGAELGVISSEIARASGIIPTEVFYPNPYRGIVRGPRTFILPDERVKAATEKYSVIESNVEGNDLIIVEDSIVRGSMSRQVQILRSHGARRIGGMVAFPPIGHACGYGVDFGTNELLASKKELQSHGKPDVEKIRQYLGLDFLYYISNNELLEAALGNPVEIEDFGDSDFCGACFTGKYPTPIDGIIAKT